MHPAALTRPLRAVLCLTLAVALAGCGGGGSSDEVPEEEGRGFIVQGGFLTGAYDPAKADALYLQTGITSRGRWGGTNLGRWDDHVRNRAYTGALDLYVRGSTNGRLVYRHARTVWGGTEPDGNVFFMMGPNKGITVSARMPEGGQTLDIADLNGEYTCLRSFPTQKTVRKDGSIPDTGGLHKNSLQLLTATFSPGSAAVDFNVLQDTRGLLPAPSTGFYELDANGRFRLTEDAAVPVMLPPEKQETLRGGAFQKQEQFLFVSYMNVQSQPSLSEVVGTTPPSAPEEVDTAGFMMCLKGGTAMTEADLNGEFWYLNTRASGASQEATSVNYEHTYGLIKADGAGHLSRIECQSPTALRQWEMSYSVQPEGQLDVTHDTLGLTGILNVDGSLALMMRPGSESDFGFEIWTKKLGPS